ncbi:MULTISPECIES: hypothetical protein [Bacteroidales]|uniref:Uncharacterized protein n=1 Tax=Odoribacter splanchnicus TaxID=28118 RepID=A0AAW5C5K5_9BACT|nr:MULTISPECIES: hypothetical protein [Bacteroidales]MBU9881560.1 hypothetical protein [Bacteroides sp. MSK.20.82]MBV4400891.1 hypothetical protein [Odoribacter splanchnicus]MBV4409333.1 hypothetical protein [Odoribacter splanchnicus]MCE9292613.1 hypothetical protein [Bacteroides thetaiotaomicron]MCG4959270.1 hypothetical protein [Odoribacter splanchnicus]
MAIRPGKERHKLPRQRQMLPRNGKRIQPLRKPLSFAGETVGTPACFRADILANLPASPPALVPAGTQAYRQRLGGKAKGGCRFNGPNARKSGGKGGQRTPQAATTTPNAATQQQRDTTLAKVIFLCRRNGRYACPYACLPAHRHGWEQAYREGCRTACSLTGRMAADRTKKRMSNK